MRQHVQTLFQETLADKPRIKRFLRRTGRPRVTDLDSTNTKQFIPSDNVVIVAKVPPSDATDEIRLEDRFRAIAAQYSDRYSFGLSRGKADETAVVHCYNNLDGAYSRTNELEQFGALEAFVKKCSLPFIPELTRRNEADYLQVSSSHLMRGERR
jgi:protein disulfide-isomerase A1